MRPRRMWPVRLPLRGLSNVPLRRPILWLAATSSTASWALSPASRCLPGEGRAPCDPGPSAGRIGRLAARCRSRRVLGWPAVRDSAAGSATCGSGAVTRPRRDVADRGRCRATAAAPIGDAGAAAHDAAVLTAIIVPVRAGAERDGCAFTAAIRFSGSDVVGFGYRDIDASIHSDSGAERHDATDSGSAAERNARSDGASSADEDALADAHEDGDTEPDLDGHGKRPGQAGRHIPATPQSRPGRHAPRARAAAAAAVAAVVPCVRPDREARADPAAEVGRGSLTRLRDTVDPAPSRRPSAATLRG